MSIRSASFRLKCYCHDTRGAAALEFAIIVPTFLAVIVGTLYACLGLVLAASLQYAVEQGARCAAVNATACPDSPTTISYTTSHYYGPSAPSPTFTYATPSCGYSVNGSISYVFDFGLSNLTVPISATACFP